MSRQPGSRAGLVKWMAVAALVACGGPPEVPGDADVDPMDGGRRDGGGTETCVADSDCANGVFCDGVERCMPGATDADSRGCVSPTSPPCTDDEECDEDAATCDMRCVDADADGHGALECGGDDCDDADANRFPGNVEVCDSTAHDEDCNPDTFGFVDADADGSGSYACCNVLPGGDLNCGGDCNDGDSTVNERAGDGPPLFCDGVDNDCSGTADEGCPCTEGETQECGTTAQRMRIGICRPGTQVCSGGVFTESCIGAISPSEEICDGLDNDCDETVDEAVLRTYYPDVDGDGFGSTSGTPISACSAPAGYSSNATDCDDTVSSVNPAATEVCNLVDDNCTGGIDEGFIATYYRDSDRDGFGDAAMATMTCAPPDGYVRNADDCDDTNGSRNPATIEGCNGVDDDCNGMVDEGLLRTFYRDADGDAWGVDGMTMMACTAPSGYSERRGDCDDTRAAANPAGIEVCNGLDDDCDTSVDEGVLRTFYADGDGDSFGRSDATMTACAAPSGHTDRSGDCNDTNAGVNPSAPELCNGRDDNCDGSTDPGCACTDGATRNCGPTTDVGECTFGTQQCIGGTWGGCIGAVDVATEVCNGRDDDCDGTIDDGVIATGCYRDGDGDGHGTGGATTQCRDASRSTFGFCPVGWTNVNDDCNDGVSAIRPGATEVCDGIDQDCDGMADEGATIACYGDSDADGFGAGATVQRCPDPARTAFGMCPSGFTNVATDCNDFASTVRPGAPELCNDVDDDCDGTVDDGVRASPCHADSDGDGYGAGPVLSLCRDATRSAQGYCPIGYTNVATDCNDANPGVRPGGTESCNGIDDDCDGTVDEGALLTCYADADDDGYAAAGATAELLCPTPGRADVGGCAIAYTNRAPTSGNIDCRDGRPNINPGEPETCDAVDNDCSGTVDDAEALTECTAAFGSAGCRAGECRLLACVPTRGSCDGDPENGCETDLLTSDEHCGACGDRCPGGCVNGLCRPVVAIARGNDHVCAVRDTGRVICWGSNTHGQLGDGTTTQRLLPVAVVGLTDATDVAAGENFTCALRSTGAVSCWGEGTFYRLGRSTAGAAEPTPVDVPGVSGATQIDLGRFHACARLATGAVTCWGYNLDGQVGRTPSTRELPAAVSGVSAAEVTAGEHTTCVRTTTGNNVVCWGANDFRQRGDSDTADRHTPGSTIVSGASEVELGSRSACAVVSGVPTCWGGAYVNGRTTDSPTPQAIAGVSGAASVAIDETAACARLTDGTRACWGHDGDGVFGDGTDPPLWTTTAVVIPTPNALSDIAAGGHGTCVVRSNGAVLCWGEADSGELGDGSVGTTSFTPVRTRDVLDVVQVEVHNGHDFYGFRACARRHDGRVYCWGTGRWTSGGSASDEQLTPLAMASNAVDLAAGGEHVCVRNAARRLRCWGGNSAGQLGDGTTTDRFSFDFVPGLTDVIAVDVSSQHTCAVVASGQTYCFGHTGNTQSGIWGPPYQVTSPNAIPGATTAVDVSVGDTHSCALLRDGQIVCWGERYVNGRTSRDNTAAAIAGNDFVSTTGGRLTACGATSDGQARCWGNNGFGQFGTGLTSGDTTTPMTTSTLSAIRIVETGDTSCAIEGAAGDLYCWGSDTYGQVGDGASTGALAPRAIGLGGVSHVSSGSRVTCAVAADGVYCWGDGPLGDGTASSSAVPVPVPALYEP